MKIFLIVILFLLVSVAPIYALMPYETGYSEESNNTEAAQMNNEKQNIIKNITQAREDREKNLRPFVQIADEGAESSFDGTVKTNAAIEREEKRPYVKTPAYGPKPNPGINFVAIFLSVLSLSSYFA